MKRPARDASSLAAPATPDPLRIEVGVARLIRAWLSGKSPRTLEAYREDLRVFATYLASRERSVEAFLRGAAAEANWLAIEYRGELIANRLAPATVNRRLAAVRSLTTLAQQLGVTPWRLEVASLRGENYRDTKGPGREGVKKLLACLAQGGQSGQTNQPRAIRNRALIRLLYDVALRRGEVAALDLADLDLTAHTVAIVGKGKREKTLITLPDPTAAALVEWVNCRGTAPGPLFTNFDRAKKGQQVARRLTGRSVHRLVVMLGQQAGITARPHGLRHSAITESLERTQGNVRAVQRFSRHAKLDTLLRYDDNRRDLAGEIAKLLAADL